MYALRIPQLSCCKIAQSGSAHLQLESKASNTLALSRSYNRYSARHVMASLPTYTVTVRGSDQRQIYALRLGREATQRALAWPLQVMFRAPYESAELDINSQGEVVKHRVKWQDCTTPYQQNRKRYYQYRLDNPKELQPVWGQWASF